MSLFNTNDIEPIISKDKSFDAIAKFSQHTKFLIAKNRAHLKELIPVLEQNLNYEFVNYGRWSAHDLLFHLLSLTGPSKVYIATWAISQTAITLLHQGIESGLILELHAILDRRLPVRKPKAAQFIKGICTRSILEESHSENFLIENDIWKVSSTMTCNFSNNKRIETGKFSTYHDNYLFHKNWMDNILASPDRFNWNRK